MDKKVFYKLTYGMCIVSTQAESKKYGQIANTVFQVTSNPPKITVSINKKNATYEGIKRSGKFAVSILRKDAEIELIQLFGFKSSRDVDKFHSIRHMQGSIGLPIVTEQCIGYLEAKVVAETDVGSHVLFVGEVVNAAVLDDAEPMTYAYYHKIKGGRAPKSAPTYVESTRVADRAGQYRCKVCGYTYDPTKGDPKSNIPLGTKFDNLPEEWVCPVCGAGKEKFEPV